MREDVLFQGSMKLYASTTSPFVRKVRIAALEKNVLNHIELISVTTTPIEPNQVLTSHNPLAKIPALVLDSGQTLYDSAVICEYLDSLSARPLLLPHTGPERWRILTMQAEADGLMDAGIMVRYERLLRPKEFQYEPWVLGQINKVQQVLKHWNQEASAWNHDIHLGSITVVCALDWLTFRKPFEIDWTNLHTLSTWHMHMSERASFRETYPQA